jgi:hypothetical protein
VGRGLRDSRRDDAPKYKDFILPRVFYKRLSDVFDDEFARKVVEFDDEAYLVMGASRDRVRSMARRAVAQSSINRGNVKSLPLPIPSIEEQQQISSVLRACDKTIALLEKESTLLDEFFRALLEELMTGRLSVTALIESP